MSVLGANAAVLVGVLLAGFSALLAVVGCLTWRRVGHSRLGWVTLAFGVFFVEGIALTRDAYLRRGDIASNGWDALPLLALGNLVVVLALYMAVLKR